MITKSVARRYAKQKKYRWLRCGPGLILVGPDGEVFLQNEEASEVLEELRDAETDWKVQQIIDGYSELME